MLLNWYICWSYYLTIYKWAVPLYFPPFLESRDVVSSLLTSVCFMKYTRNSFCIHEMEENEGFYFSLCSSFQLLLKWSSQNIFSNMQKSLYWHLLPCLLFVICFVWLYTKAPVIFPFDVWTLRDMTVMRGLVGRKRLQGENMSDGLQDVWYFGLFAVFVFMSVIILVCAGIGFLFNVGSF